MKKLTKQDLFSLEKYSEIRDDFRTKIMAHKKTRIVALGPHATLHFEDRLTMQYQIQEMLRAERIYEAAGIVEELEAYNPLIPDGNNWKATLMFEYENPEERKVQLQKLIGAERKVWIAVDGFDRIYPICNEDLERETEEKTASVHFLRFELSKEMIMSVKKGAGISIGIDHSHYQFTLAKIDAAIRDLLASDLDAVH